MAGEVSVAQIADAIGKIRFDRHLERFEFKPSIGIVASQLTAFADELQDMHEPLKKSVEDVMQYSILENFMTAGRGTWEELTLYTVRKRKGKAEPILVWSGALAEGGSSPKIWSIGAKTALIRDLPKKIWYGKVHQAGAEGGGGGSGRMEGDWMDKYRREARQMAPRGATEEQIEKTAGKLSDPIFRQKLGLKQMTETSGGTDSATIPARPWAVFQDEDIDAIEQIFVEWVEDKLREVGKFS